MNQEISNLIFPLGFGFKMFFLFQWGKLVYCLVFFFWKNKAYFQATEFSASIWRRTFTACRAGRTPSAIWWETIDFLRRANFAPATWVVNEAHDVTKRFHGGLLWLTFFSPLFLPLFIMTGDAGKFGTHFFTGTLFFSNFFPIDFHKIIQHNF